MNIALWPFESSLCNIYIAILRSFRKRIGVLF